MVINKHGMHSTRISEIKPKPKYKEGKRQSADGEKERGEERKEKKREKREKERELTSLASLSNH